MNVSYFQQAGDYTSSPISCSCLFAFGVFICLFFLVYLFIRGRSYLPVMEDDGAGRRLVFFFFCQRQTL